MMEKRREKEPKTRRAGNRRGISRRKADLWCRLNPGSWGEGYLWTKRCLSDLNKLILQKMNTGILGEGVFMDEK
jgi:hypothetical protein